MVQGMVMDQGQNQNYESFKQEDGFEFSYWQELGFTVLKRQREKGDLGCGYELSSV